VRSHAENFPDTDHDCVNISQADPRRYPRTDVLWASPECTNHLMTHPTHTSDHHGTWGGAW
jgi:DNA (cytosine-5)-methyltransferase 1